MNLFTFEVHGITGNCVYADLGPDMVEIDIQAKTINEAADSIRDYLAKSYLKCNRVVLKKIKFIEK